MSYKYPCGKTDDRDCAFEFETSCRTTGCKNCKYFNGTEYYERDKALYMYYAETAKKNRPAAIAARIISNVCCAFGIFLGVFCLCFIAIGPTATIPPLSAILCGVFSVLVTLKLDDLRGD